MQFSRVSPRRVLLAVSAVSVLTVGACAPIRNDGSGSRESLRNSLPVAEAALEAGQPAVARRLYLSLAEHFDDAPEPALGLAYVALYSGDFVAAEHHFLQAAERADNARATKAEALLGAGRAALARAETQLAREHFSKAGELESGAPSRAWASNGLAVAAALDGDYETAEEYYLQALRDSSDDPRIAANLVRLLIAAGRIDDAAKLHAERGESYWVDEDGRALARLIEGARRGTRAAGSGISTMDTGSGLSLRIFASKPPPVERVGLPEPSGLLLRVSSRPVQPAPTATSSATAAASDSRKSTALVPDEVPSATLTLTLGQSRRFHLDGEATTVLVASPEVADVQLLSPDLLYVIGKAVGRTSVVVLRDNARVQEQTVVVVPDLEQLMETLAKDPNLRGVRVRYLPRGIALTGEVASAASADRAQRLAQASLPEETVVENELWIAESQQVNLEVQIAEVQRSITEDLGINWEAFRDQGNTQFGFRVGRVIGDTITGGVGIGAFPPTTVDGTLSPSVFFRKKAGKATILGMIDALARAGLANVLARPNVTAVSGETASFFSGGEYPLPTGFEDGVIIFEYKKYGVLLDFVPTVIDVGRISLTVRPEVSEPSLSESVSIVGVDIPVINVRRAETTVEVGDGESIVIAGLFRNASNTVETGVPVLKDVPGLNVLFGKTSIRSDELELIVVVTARLVRAGAALEEAHAPPAARKVGGFHY